VSYGFALLMFCFVCFLSGQLIFTQIEEESIRALSQSLNLLEGRMARQQHEFDQIISDQQDTLCQLMYTIPLRDASVARAVMMRAKRTRLREERDQGLARLADIDQRLLELQSSMGMLP